MAIVAHSRRGTDREFHVGPRQRDTRKPHDNLERDYFANGVRRDWHCAGERTRRYQIDDRSD